VYAQQETGGKQTFYLVVCLGSGTHILSYLMGSGYGDLSWRVKVPQPVTDHFPPSNVEVKMHGAMPPLPHIHSWRGA
jgi:hypothetical protein